MKNVHLPTNLIVRNMDTTPAKIALALKFKRYIIAAMLSSFLPVYLFPLKDQIMITLSERKLCMD